MPEPKRTPLSKGKPQHREFAAQTASQLDRVQIAQQQEDALTGSTTDAPGRTPAEPALVTKLIDFIKAL